MRFLHDTPKSDKTPKPFLIDIIIAYFTNPTKTTH